MPYLAVRCGRDKRARVFGVLNVEPPPAPLSIDQILARGAVIRMASLSHFERLGGEETARSPIVGWSYVSAGGYVGTDGGYSIYAGTVL